MRKIVSRGVDKIRFVMLGMALVWIGCAVNMHGKQPTTATAAVPDESCRDVCVEYDTRNRCQKRCARWEDGFCAAHENVCLEERYCVSQRSECD